MVPPVVLQLSKCWKLASLVNTTFLRVGMCLQIQETHQDQSIYTQSDLTRRFSPERSEDKQNFESYSVWGWNAGCLGKVCQIRNEVICCFIGS